ncbi:hypothetical protein HMJ29_12870 [Hymenobacter taeanensis]|uniref:Uncharacterized protein n=1 Tax=Hymenobacter taeanensis TaxID=2735321 RepID=A0A6M6BL34_9BACT|nr:MULTISPECIES: hypothetical protein [Hymenobacter]QJX47785.1 hypothetical protein HMJ29_12870 [Hymenobacter taeanensis]UOQ82727.1 hypothetical protein MUN83_08195 [Hymenobacter sp. 5414T-23]
MASKILSFICHVPASMPGAYPSMPASTSASRNADRKAEPKSAGGHFTAIYENERFVRFKYINNAS